jgi:hypothetical protein
MKAQSLRSFFLGGPSSQALTSFVAFVLRTLREEPVVAGVKLHRKKILPVSPSPAGMSLTKLSLDGKNLIIPVQGEFGQ